MQTDDEYFAILAGAGVSVFVSSGDGGSSPGLKGYGDNTGPLQVESPASDPNVTAVGGTSHFLNISTGAVSSENAWSLGGGGSQVFGRPVWQNGAGVPAGTFRLVPDVPAVADLNTGGYLIFSGQLYEVGGTSWSAPTWAGICARINQVRYNAATQPLGLLGPKIYPLLGSSRLFQKILWNRDDGHGEIGRVGGTAALGPCTSSSTEGGPVRPITLVGATSARTLRWYNPFVVYSTT
jgi:subtilase family serine protease